MALKIEIEFPTIFKLAQAVGYLGEAVLMGFVLPASHPLATTLAQLHQKGQTVIQEAMLVGKHGVH